MKTFKAICASTILALSLSIPAFADTTAPGDGHTPGAAAPSDNGAPTAAPGNSGLIGAVSSVGSDIKFPTVEDILWVLASIY